MDSFCSRGSDADSSGADGARPRQEPCLHLLLRGRRAEALVSDGADWRALEGIARRASFWCGCVIYACRCQGSEMRFALDPGRCPAGGVARHISSSYGVYLRRRHGWMGRVFDRHRAVAIDGALYLDDLVLWLHRPVEAAAPPAWTAEQAYTSPGSCNWIATARVLAAFSPSGSGRSAYLRRRAQPLPVETVELLTGARRHDRGVPTAGRDAGAPDESSIIESVVRWVAEYAQVPGDVLRSPSRKRSVARATTLVTVLASRSGASIATIARALGRSRSTLIERVDHQRRRHPEIFERAWSVLEVREPRRRFADPGQAVQRSQPIRKTPSSR